MALGFVQGAFTEASGTTISKAFSVNVSTGDIIVAFLQTDTSFGGATFTQSAGTAGISWNALGATQFSSGGATFVRHDAFVTSGGSCTINVTIVNPSGGALQIGEYNIGGHTLVKDGSPDNVGSSQATTTSFASGSITTTNNPAVLIC